jgi:hypothetical protein
MSQVINEGAAVCQYIVKKDKHKPPKKGFEQIVLKTLKSGRGVVSPKGITRNS